MQTSTRVSQFWPAQQPAGRLVLFTFKLDSSILLSLLLISELHCFLFHFSLLITVLHLFRQFDCFFFYLSLKISRVFLQSCTQVVVSLGSHIMAVLYICTIHCALWLFAKWWPPERLRISISCKTIASSQERHKLQLHIFSV